jgi:ribulose-bisphosphate carboxylase small chain
MWKLPMFGCSDANQVLMEINECRRAYPQCYIRLAAFDSVKQVQVVSFVVHQPSTVSAWAIAGEKDEKDMKVWNPIDNKKFETFSFLPALTDAEIGRQVQMVIAKNLAPCLEFSSAEDAYVSSVSCGRFSGSTAGYYDNRYWTMWKLPMFGCSDASQVLNEIAQCKAAYPQCYIRLAAFDSVKQVQVVSFVVHQPGAAVSSSYSAPAAAAAPAPAVDAWNSWAVTGEKEMMEE